MREILFRGKRTDNGEWVVGSLICWDDGSCLIETGSLLEPQYAIDPATIGQYTGLDTNGKKIFEGDILRFGLLYDYERFRESLECPDAYDGEVYDQDIEVAVVEWCIDYDYPAFDLKDHRFECNGLAQLMCGDYEYEVIGNIHDNPELMKGK